MPIKMIPEEEARNKVKAIQDKKNQEPFKKKLKRRLQAALDIYVRGPEKVLEERAESKEKRKERKFTAEESEKERKHKEYLASLTGSYDLSQKSR